MSGASIVITRPGSKEPSHSAASLSRWQGLENWTFLDSIFLQNYSCSLQKKNLMALTFFICYRLAERPSAYIKAHYSRSYSTLELPNLNCEIWNLKEYKQKGLLEFCRMSSWYRSTNFSDEPAASVFRATEKPSPENKSAGKGIEQLVLRGVTQLSVQYTDA